MMLSAKARRPETHLVLSRAVFCFSGSRPLSVGATWRMGSHVLGLGVLLLLLLWLRGSRLLVRTDVRLVLATFLLPVATSFVLALSLALVSRSGRVGAGRACGTAGAARFGLDLARAGNQLCRRQRKKKTQGATVC